MKNLSTNDVLGLAVCWSGAAAVTHLANEPVVSVIGIAAAYYLSKWLILKEKD